MFKQGITNPKAIHLKNNISDIVEVTLNVIIREKEKGLAEAKNWQFCF